VKALVLAAGEGSRLRPLTTDRPKCLVELDGISLLDRQLAVLNAQAVAPVIVVGGYLADMLPRPGIEVRLNPRYALTNMVSTLFCAEADLVGGALVTYGDIVYSASMLKPLLAASADIAVAIDLGWEAYWRARGDDPLADAETLRLDADGRILEIGQKPGSLDQIEGQYMGLMKFSASGVEILRSAYHGAVAQGSLRGKPVEKAYMTDLLQHLIDLGHPVQAVPVRGDWVEVDTVGDLNLAITRERLQRIQAENQL
jgi:choline kinase